MRMDSNYGWYDHSLHGLDYLMNRYAGKDDDPTDIEAQGYRIENDEKLMANVDPNAYEEYKKLTENRGGSYSKEAISYMKNWIEKQKSMPMEGSISVSDAKATSMGEKGLSDKAWDFLKSLREKYGDYDISVAGAGDSIRGLHSRSTKEFSVVFSNEEIERMANDEEYANKMLGRMEDTIETARNASKEQGYSDDPLNPGKNGFLSKLAITVNDDGTMSLFAEFEKAMEKQRDRMGDTVKRTSVRANSLDELREKIAGIDWEKVKGTQRVPGQRVDFSA